MISISLKSQPDEFGFIYGTAHKGEETLLINVMPPEPEWRGGLRLEGYEPHATDWVLYVAGEEVGRVTSRSAVEAEFRRVLEGG